MSNTIIVYADDKYYSLKYFTSTDEPHKLTEICDSTNKLHNILPKTIRSRGNDFCIVGIDNMIHHVFLDGNNTVYKFRSNYYKMTLEEFRFAGYIVWSSSSIDYCLALFENMEPDEQNSFEYFTASYEQNKTTTKIEHLMIDKQMVECDEQITWIKRDRVSQPFYNFSVNDVFCDANGNPIQHIHYIASNCEYTFRAYNRKISTDSLRYTFLINNQHECYISGPNKCATKLATLTEHSVLLYDGNNVMIVDGNHFVVILDHDKVIRFTLSSINVYQVDSNIIKNVKWSKQNHNNWPNNYKDTIKAFMLCNMKMKQFKIPYYVLQVIFSIIVN